MQRQIYSQLLTCLDLAYLRQSFSGVHPFNRVTIGYREQSSQMGTLTA
jgi:hypothetical protein